MRSRSDAAPLLVQDAADRLAREASRRGYAPSALPADAYPVSDLPHEGAVVFVVATAGQGEPTGNFSKFWRFLMRAALPTGSLSGLRVAVFGLGDSGYPEFNVVAKKLAARLAQLGAASLTSLALADDASPAGADGALDTWMPTLWEGLRAAGREPPAPDGGRPADADADAGGWADRFAVAVDDAGGRDPEYQPSLDEALAAHVAFAALDAAAAGGSAPAAASPPGRGPAAPARATVAAAARLTAPAHWQDVRHLELALQPPTPHAPGDVAAVLPAQSSASVRALLAALALAPDACLSVTAPTAPSTHCVRATAAALVAGVLELDGAPPRRRLFQALAAHARPSTPETVADRLAHFSSADGRDDLHLYCAGEARTLAEVLTDFSAAGAPPLAALLTAAPRLRPRRFSIASWRAEGRSIDLCVAVVDYRTPHGRRARGLASGWLAGLAPGDTAPAWVEPGSLAPAPETVPLILVGPGTGVAPARSLLQRRAALAASADAAGAPRPPPCHLFFGCRNREADCLYMDEFEGMVERGVLAPDGLHVACSRDGASKVYVTHLIKQASSTLWAALEAGAWVVVAGSAKKMPADVRAAFEAVAVEAGGMDASGARAWLRRLVAAGRYSVEAWA